MADELYGEMERTAKVLADKQLRFDRVNELSRKMIRDCAKAITLLHNGDSSAASSSIKEALSMKESLSEVDRDFRYISVQAYQELAEAMILQSIKLNGTIPSASKIGLDREPYVLGLMDVVGELKRGILISAMDGDIESALRYYSLMGRIYDSTRSLRFAEPVLPTFRKKQDVARIQLESAGSDLLRFSSGARGGRANPKAKRA